MTAREQLQQLVLKARESFARLTQREQVIVLGGGAGMVLLVLAARYETVERSCRNLREVRVILADSLNVVDLLEADTVVFTSEALTKAQEVYG